MSPEERQQVEHDTQLAIYRFQADAYRNLRHSVAAAIVIFGLFIGSDAFLGNADGARLWPCLVLLLSAALGVGYFATTNARPRLGMQLLLAGVVTAVIGIALLIVVRYGAG
jgi:hypothetical protein